MSGTFTTVDCYSAPEEQEALDAELVLNQSISNDGINLQLHGIHAVTAFLLRISGDVSRVSTSDVVVRHRQSSMTSWTDVDVLEVGTLKRNVLQVYYMCRYMYYIVHVVLHSEMAIGLLHF